MRMKPVPRGEWAGWGCTQHRLRTCRRGGHPTSAVCDFHGNRPRWRACAQEHRGRRRFGDHPVAGSGYEWIVLGISAAVFACAAVLTLSCACGVPRAWAVMGLSMLLLGQDETRLAFVCCLALGLPSLSVPGWYVASTSFSAMWTFSAKAVYGEKTFTACCFSRNAVVCTVNVPLAARHGLPRNSR